MKKQRFFSLFLALLLLMQLLTLPVWATQEELPEEAPEELSEEMEETARLRLKYPEASLKELGELHNPPVGKSGVNHRLRKLSEIAEELRENKEEQTW